MSTSGSPTPSAPPPLRPVTGKDKSSRVPLDYYKHLSDRKKKVTWVLLGLVGVVLAVSLASGYWREMASPGKVHVVHAEWEHDCSVCHLPLQPTSSRNGLRGALGVGQVSDALCKKCHAGPPHHPGREIAEEVGSCASCHTEHHGRRAQLSLVADSTCTKCHADLEKHVKDGKPLYEKTVTNFDRDHPQFRIGLPGKRQPLDKVSDPGKLRFNHEVHLAAGMKTQWHLDQITDPELRERYRKEQDNKEDKDPVQLTCASCHQLDAADAPTGAPGGGSVTRTMGEYFQPTTYEQHCKACHPLTFDPRLPKVEVPHLLQPEQVRRFLWGVYGGEEVKELKKKSITDRPLPGMNLTREAQQEAKARIAGRVGEAESILFQQDVEKAMKFATQGKAMCGLCHQYTSGPEKKIVPPDVPRVWYPHSKFSHKAHRMAECKVCHDAEKSTKNSDVLLPGVENCRKCHAPSGVVKDHKVGGVRYDCVTCHRYHNGERPQAGLGAAKRGIEKRKPLQDFLDGK
jgi:hypothetical protein